MWCAAWGAWESRKTTARMTPRMCSSGHTPNKMRCGRPRPLGLRSAIPFNSRAWTGSAPFTKTLTDNGVVMSFSEWRAWGQFFLVVCLYVKLSYYLFTNHVTSQYFRFKLLTNNGNRVTIFYTCSFRLDFLSFNSTTTLFRKIKFIATDIHTD